VLAVAVFLYVAAERGTASWLAKYGEVELGLYMLGLRKQNAQEIAGVVHD